MKQFKRSPWGPVQYQENITDDIAWVGTAGHGGCKVSPKLNRTIPDHLRNDNGWYEEDCEWAKAYVALEQHILANANDQHSINVIKEGHHKDTLRNWYPDAYELVYGKTLQPGESYERDKQIFRQKHKNDYVCVSARMDSDDPGMVIVSACIGGRNENGQYPSKLTEFHVTSEEYETRDKFGFVVDPERHKALAS